MCIENLYTYNNSKLIYKSNFPNLFVKYKCGKCFECQESKSKELNYRSYWEGIDTYEKGGYIVFDTLTYADEYLPHINDVLGLKEEDNFSCFNNKHIVDFLKRLRIALSRLDKANTIKIQWTGEYGTTEGNTHRPHYHLIIYYYNKNGNNLEPKLLSYMISNKWKFGRTDGVKYKGKTYFYRKRVFKSTNPYTLNIYRYVSKYIEKNSIFQGVIDDRINTILIKKGLSNNLNYYEKLESRKIKNHIRQTNRISKNFGIKALEYINIDDVMKTNLVSIPDTKYIKRTLTLPLYYRRKLFMNLMYYNIGDKVYSKWIYNDLGRKYKSSLFNVEYDNLISNTRNQILNTKHFEEVHNLLAGRTIIDFCNYIILYKNKLFAPKSKEEYLENIFNENGELYFNYSTSKDKADYGGRYLIKTPINLYHGEPNIDKFKAVNENYETKFNNFDKLYAILSNESKAEKKTKQLQYEELKKKKEDMKLIKYRYNVY